MYAINGMRHITLDWIKNYQFQLIAFTRIKEQDIQNIWRQFGEEGLSDFTAPLAYDYRAPLYQKMIHRFRNGNRLATTLFKGCDPNNQYQLIRYFEIDLELIEFFSWITNSLGAYGIFQFESDRSMEIDESPLVNLWKKNPNIIFFFLLSKEMQEKFIVNYNSECVDKYNEMINCSKINKSN